VIAISPYYRGTEAYPDTYTSTEVWYPPDLWVSTQAIELPETDPKEMQLILNAEKATATMVILAKIYAYRTPVTLYFRPARRLLKLMFCTSGYLPKRIRRKKKLK